MRSLVGQILTPDGWITGEIRFDERIRAIRERAATSRHDLPRIVPGFIDLHVHGGGGVDVMQGGGAAQSVASFHAQFGTTAMLATTMTDSRARIEAALAGIASAMAAPANGGARILGAHLEGPFISSARLGAQPAGVLPATLEKVRQFSAIAPIRVLTLAPEVADHLELIPQLAELGIRVQIGHSSASYEVAAEALRRGAVGFTHLFNGMTGASHRDPGVATAALAHGEYAELIPDLEHVHPGTIRQALRAIRKLYFITDATAAAGMPDGDYTLGTQSVVKCRGCVKLKDGSSLAGSALTMDQALRNLVSLGLDLGDVSRRLSAYPAEYLGIEDERGRIQAGACADLVVLDADLNVTQVFLEGAPCPRVNATKGLDLASGNWKSNESDS